MNELHKHKSADRVKWVFTFTALFLIVVMLIGMCLQLFGSDKQKPSNWFDDDKKVDTSEENKQLNGGMTLDIPEVSASLALSSYSIPQEEFSDYGVSAAAESATLLRCTVLPEDCTNKAVIWTVEWGSGEWNWDEGKNVTDYVNLTSNGNECTLSCMLPFSCPINVVCTSAENAELSSVCRLDYVKRVLSVDLGFDIVDDLTMEYTSSNLYTLLSYNGVIPVYRVTYSDGTVKGEFKCGSLITTLSDELYSTLYRVNSNTLQSTSNFINCDLNNVDRQVLNIRDVYIFINGVEDSAWYNQLYLYAKANPVTKHATLSMTYSYKFTSYYDDDDILVETSGTATCDLIFGVKLLEKPAQSVSIDNSTLVF